MPRALAALVFMLIAPAAMANPQVPAGRQETPPGPPDPTPEPLSPNASQRQAIRGCPVERDCHAEAIRGLHEFEVRNFRSRKGPWAGDSDRPAPGRVFRRSKNPLELRPDLPWLGNLKLPDVPVHWDERLIKYLEFYKDDPRGRNLMASWLKARGRYRDLITRNLRKARLPQALLYIAMIESSYDATEYSRAGASGLWQFMPAGGRVYGLEINRWLDERNDPVRSTEAAMLYFRDLYQRFGDWNLALAAYNAGYGAILRSMAKYNTNDFWKLLDYENALPWESGVYVPKFLAAAIVGENPKVFGFEDVSAAPAHRFENVSVPASTTLASLARAAGTSKSAIEALNPQLRRGRTPPNVKKYVVRIPAGTKAKFSAQYAQLRGDWDDYDAYVVSHGERFEDIATLHGISRRKLRQLNEIETEKEVEGGMVLVVPRLDAGTKRTNLAKARDDLYASGVPGGKPGDQLIVAVPDPNAVIRGKKRVFYRVVGGDTQFGIARAFGIPRESLAEWNGLDAEAHLHAQMILQVWVANDFKPETVQVAVLDPSRVRVVKSGSEEHLNLAEERVGRKRLVYEAKKRESFEDVGKKFGLSHRDLARINRMSPFTVLEPGQTVLVYQVVDTSASDRAAEQAKSARRSAPKKPKPKPQPKAKPAPSKPTDKRNDAPKGKQGQAAPSQEAPPAEQSAQAAPKQEQEPKPEPRGDETAVNTVQAPTIVSVKAPAPDGPKAEAEGQAPPN